jgi:hypothetical protein
MTRASDIKDRMRHTALRERGTPEGVPPAEQPAPEVPPAASRPPAPARRIRYTLDLSPPQHRFLKRFAVDAEVDASAVVRALLAELEHDAQLAARVQAQVARPAE